MSNLNPKQFMPIPEGTLVRRSGGKGHLPGDESHSITAMLPVSHLKRYMEYDRAGRHSHGPASEEVINNIASDIRKGGVIKEPLILEHNTQAQWGYLGEGHHRLVAAERAGLTHVPVTVYSGAYPDKHIAYKQKGIGASLTLTNPHQWANFPGDDYQPKELHPGHFREFQ